MEGGEITVSLDTAELVAAPPSEVPESVFTYDVDLELGNGVAELSRAGNEVTLYSFGTNDWAIVLPDGRYTGSNVVDRYLAFYNRSRDAAQRRRDRSATKSKSSTSRAGSDACRPPALARQ